MLLLAILVSAAAAQTPAEFFETRVRPVLAANCYGCHSAKNATSGLALDSKAGLDKGGKRGTAVVAGEPDASLLLRAVAHTGALRMPPTGKLPGNVIADLRQWIEQGAVFPVTEAVGKTQTHWAFQPVRDSKPGARIDDFLNTRLQQTQLTPAPPADKRDLLRRVSFDLTGLSPGVEELEAFVRDNSPQAFAKVVDRLLASPHYAERWARHWLDLVRFAETNGHEFDFYKYEAWRYRDYTIRAFAQDLPYNQFVAEHIAGDLLPAQRLAPGGHWDTPIATGLFGLQEERNGATDLEEVRAEMRDSKIDVFGKAFLGLTVACARCHDHKFDPITTADYYALGGIIDSTRTTLRSIESPAIAAANAEAIRGAAVRRKAVVSKLRLRAADELFDDFDDPRLGKWQRSGSAFRHHADGLLDSSRLVSNQLTGILVSPSFIPKRKYVHVRLAGTKFRPVREEPSLLAVTIFASGRYPKGVAGDGDRTLRWKTISLKEEIGQVCHFEIADRQRDGHIAVDAIVFSDDKQPPDSAEETLDALPETTVAFQEEPFGRVSYEDAPHNLRLHVRGSHLNLGEETPRRFLTVLGGDQPARFAQGSGRLALAQAMTEASNPLVARVMVNRIWQHHFGQGLVATPDNFGRLGERPSHPELLDWLATRFVENGWSVKAMHRLILLSDAYQRSTDASAEALAKDPRNRLLAHMAVRRLDAESIRDAVLAVSGSLDRQVYGPSITPHISPYQDGRGKPVSGPLDSKGRRSLYIEVRRNFLSPLLLAFDYPLPATTTGRRSVSSVPSQALTLMNNEFIAQQSERWAQASAQQFFDPRERLDAMWLRAFARTPSAGERQRIEEFLKAGGTWPEVAHVLFNMKEFIFIR